ncbi:MAG: cell division protein ZapE, partial [Steroidobacteraceae bacterium]
VYLCGGVGRGKTWLMDLFFQSLPLQGKRRRHFHRFMHDVHRELGKLRKQAAPLETIADRIAADLQVLCFDELCVADIADAMLLAGLLRALIERGVTLVITSNTPPRGLYPDGLQRQQFVPAIALLEQHAEVVALDGGIDYRLRQLTRAPIYLDATDATTPHRLAQYFTTLADGAEARLEPLRIAGRRIAVVRESDNVVWFDFAALCAGPRSQDDYIEIAREYQSVIVAGVPVFDEASNNEARRFIALVDELYDHSANLVVAAAAAPAALYRGDRLVRDFQRTASRLVEMQSEEYLARGHRA